MESYYAGEGSPKVADVVLLHGTTQGPSGWDLVTEQLSTMGHRGHAVELDSSDESTCEDYADIVADQLELHSPPVVVAHSGAGLILPATARALGAIHQVWLAAIVPEGRISLLDEMRDESTEMFHPEWIGVNPVDDPQAAAGFLFHDCTPATQAWALTTLRLFVPGYAYSHAVPLAEEIPSTYVACSLDRTLTPHWCTEAAQRRLGVEATVLHTGHCPHVSDPKGVAHIISAATGTPSR